jgi:AP-3 complex subunit delta-1
MYIQALLKIFGSWAIEVAQRWGDNDLKDLKDKVKSIIDRMRELAASRHIEVQERVSIRFVWSYAHCLFFGWQSSNAFQLFNFVSADINSYHPKGLSMDGSPNMIENISGSNEPTFPKSLYLIGPLCNSYELNTIASGAQASIPTPEGLDLDAWIVPPREPTPQPRHEIEEIAKKKKSKKGKGKAVDLSVNGKTKAKANGDADMLTLVESDRETLEAKTLREQVRTR